MPAADIVECGRGGPFPEDGSSCLYHLVYTETTWRLITDSRMADDYPGLRTGLVSQWSIDLYVLH